MNIFKKIFELLSFGERKKFCILVFMMFSMAVLDAIGIASIMPFITILLNPKLIDENIIASIIFNYFDFSDSRYFLLFLASAVFVILLISLLFKSITTYFQLRFIHMQEFLIGQRLMKIYIFQNYGWFLNQHSADLGKKILSEVNLVINGSLVPVMTLISQTFVVTIIVVLVLIIDPKPALIMGTVFMTLYYSIYKSVSSYLNKAGKDQGLVNTKRFIAVNEAFGGIKEIKLLGLENSYIHRFSVPAEQYARHQASLQIVSHLPRFVFEALVFGCMLIIIMYKMTDKESFASAIPIISLYAFAGYRMMPALQQIFISLSTIKFAGDVLNRFHNDMKNLKLPTIDDFKADPLNFKENITLTNIHYSYPRSTKETINNISLKIPYLSTVGFIGSTGSGKTTIIDLILGLLDLERGILRVDDKIVDVSNKREWQKNVGYVPQQIYLVDDTISANIAFGINADEIDYKAVVSAAEVANLHDFVLNELPQGYETHVGENGVRLSGGQRQRIGIARALYRKPQLLVLDEATSALDSSTEKAIMEAVEKLSNKITIIIIAHRLSTVVNCDLIYLIDKGRIKASGSYNELILLNK
jgi:ABC-type multidrug transport system fused ATPase/permease subunit